MENVFYQRRIFNSTTYILKHDRIYVKVKKLFNQQEFEISYEKVGSKLIYTKRGIKGWLISAIVLIALTCILYIDRLLGGDVERGAEIFYGLFSLICGFIYLITFKNSVFLVNKNNINAIEFFNNISSKQQLEEFIFAAREKRKEYLVNRYGLIRKHLGYESQFNDLCWLYDNDVIEEAEYQEKLKALELVISKPVKVVGFKSTFNR